jgi:hypothetical protein
VYGAQSYDSRKRDILPFSCFIWIAHFKSQLTNPYSPIFIHPYFISLYHSPQHYSPFTPNTIHHTSTLQPSSHCTLYFSCNFNRHHSPHFTLYPLHFTRHQSPTHSLPFTPLALHPNSPLQFIKFITLPFNHSPYFNHCH